MVERDRLIGLVFIGDLIKIQIAEIEMEAAATENTPASAAWVTTRKSSHETIART
jgi:hypothetical protein